jgi:hypothetical protein
VRIVPLSLLIGTAFGTVAIWAGDVFRLWKVNPANWTAPRFSGESFAVRFEPHTKGEVFTLDRIDADGRSTTSSTILYLDGKPRDFQGFGCSGSQSSRRLDSQTVEIVRTCVSGEWTRFVRRLSTQPKELVLEITEQQPDGRHVERRVVLGKR